MRHRKCLVYTLIRSDASITQRQRRINQQRSTQKTVQSERERNPITLSFSIQSQKMSAPSLTISQPAFFFLHSRSTRTAREREKSKNLSCHRAHIGEKDREGEREKKDSLTEEASDGTAANLNFICIKNWLLLSTRNSSSNGSSTAATSPYWYSNNPPLLSCLLLLLLMLDNFFSFSPYFSLALFSIISSTAPRIFRVISVLC